MKRSPRSAAGEHEDGRDPGCQPTAANPVVLEPIDRGVHREREEDRDQDPGENLARDPDELESSAQAAITSAITVRTLTAR